MAIASKKDIIATFQRKENDCGSSEVQIALLTNRINHLIEHTKQHKKDNHTRRGLVLLVGQRKKLMKYYRRKDPKGFLATCKKLKLKVKD